MKCTINIDFENTDFDGSRARGELQRILTELDERLSNGGTQYQLHDKDGNPVGLCNITN